MALAIEARNPSEAFPYTRVVIWLISLSEVVVLERVVVCGGAGVPRIAASRATPMRRKAGIRKGLIRGTSCSQTPIGLPIKEGREPVALSLCADLHDHPVRAARQ